MVTMGVIILGSPRSFEIMHTTVLHESEPFIITISCTGGVNKVQVVASILLD